MLIGLSICLFLSVSCYPLLSISILFSLPFFFSRYLSEELISLPLLGETLSSNTNRKMLSALKKQDTDEPPKRARDFVWNQIGLPLVERNSMASSPAVPCHSFTQLG